jgi:hypothetical protein
MAQVDAATAALDRFGHSPENTYTALSELTGVPASTLWHRDHGCDSIQQRAAKQQRLNPQEEKALEDGTVCGPLEDASEDNAVLCIRWQYLPSLLMLESGNLNGSHTKGRPSHPSESTPFVTARFIHENIMIRAEARIP